MSIHADEIIRATAKLTVELADAKRDAATMTAAFARECAAHSNTRFEIAEARRRHAAAMEALRWKLTGPRVAELEEELEAEKARTARWAAALVEFGDVIAGDGE